MLFMPKLALFRHFSQTFQKYGHFGYYDIREITMSSKDENNYSNWTITAASQTVITKQENNRDVKQKMRLTKGK